MRLCKDCKHVKPFESYNGTIIWNLSMCGRPSIKQEINPVDGTPTNLYCTTQRLPYDEFCGPDGKFFESLNETKQN